MNIDILTLFPGMFAGPFNESIIKRAVNNKLVNIAVRQLRDYADSKHRIVDAPPYGGGPGMVLKPEPLFEAVDDIKKHYNGAKPPSVILTSPQGEVFNQQIAAELAKLDGMIIICGRYEGVDQRFVDYGIDRQISLGEFVLSGGEPAAIAITDAIVRLLPGAVGNPDSAPTDTFAQPGQIAPPVYTRPAEYRGLKVPDILLSGDHAQIQEWRRRSANAPKQPPGPSPDQTSP